MQKNNVGKIMADCRSKEALLKRANEKIVQLEQSVKNYEEVIEAFDKDNSEKIEMRDTIPQVTARIDSAKKFMEDRQADILELENKNRKLSSNEKNGPPKPRNWKQTTWPCTIFFSTDKKKFRRLWLRLRFCWRRNKVADLFDGRP